MPGTCGENHNYFVGLKSARDVNDSLWETAPVPSSSGGATQARIESDGAGGAAVCLASAAVKGCSHCGEGNGEGKGGGEGEGEGESGRVGETALRNVSSSSSRA